MSDLPFSEIRRRRLSLPRSALLYAKCGFPLIPLYGVTNGKCDCGKADCQSAGKHPNGRLVPNGVKDATSDVPTVRNWWKRFPNANIALQLGGLSVIDIDGTEGYESASDDFRLRVDANVMTGRGVHLYVDGELDTRTGIKSGVDIKSGDRAYAVVPPSLHASGTRYRARMGRLRPLTDELVEFVLSEKRTKSVRGDGGKDTGRKVPTGHRNDFLTRRGGSLRLVNFNQREIEACLQAINLQRCNPPLDDTEVARIAASVSRYESGNGQTFGNLSEVECEEVRWLWQPYIPRQTVTILDGDPGLGKSTLTLALAAAVSNGKPIGTHGEVTRGRVLLLNPEDEASFTLRPRLEALGGNVNNVRYERDRVNVSTDGILRLRGELEEFPADLVIIDPLLAHIDENMDFYKANRTRKFMTDLGKLAYEADCAILAVRHMTKADGGNLLYKGLGSIDIIAAARSGICVVKDPDDKSARLLVHFKSNLAEKGESLRYRLSRVEGQSVPKFEWLGRSEYTDDDLASMSSEPVGRPATQRRGAMDFLRELLSGGPKPSRQVQKRAQAEGISKETLDRAKADLGVRSIKTGSTWVWTMENPGK